MSLVIIILWKTTSSINGTQRVSKFKLHKTKKTFKKIVSVVLKFHHRYSFVGLQKRFCFLTSYFEIGIRFPFSLSN